MSLYRLQTYPTGLSNFHKGQIRNDITYTNLYWLSFEFVIDLNSYYMRYLSNIYFSKLPTVVLIMLTDLNHTQINRRVHMSHGNYGYFPVHFLLIFLASLFAFYKGKMI